MLGSSRTAQTSQPPQSHWARLEQGCCGFSCPQLALLPLLPWLLSLSLSSFS